VNKTYARIPGIGTGWASFQVGLRQRLYQAADHLLVVQSTGFTEDYRRLFYRDIRCVVVRKTQRYIWMNVVLGVIIFLLCLTRFSPLPWLVVGIFCFIPVVMLIVNVVRGPSCTCQVTTNVQTVVLPTPRRLKKVPLFLDFLKTKVPSAPDGVTS
jgi:hypothetical protein